MARDGGLGWSIWWMTFWVSVVLVPILFVASLFSGCEVRKRAEKAACEKGSVDACLEVGAYYERKADDPIGFAMSHEATAIHYYERACDRDSLRACVKLGELMFHGPGSLRALPSTDERAADGLIRACLAKDEQGCSELERAMRYATVSERSAMVLSRASDAFLDGCKKKGDPEGCYRYALVMASRDRKKPDPALARTYFELACKGGHTRGCDELKDLDEAAKRKRP